MNPNFEKQPAMITYKNQPKLSGFEVDKKRDDRRLELLPHLEHFLANDEMFAGKEVSVEFSHEGVSSQVCFVEFEGNKYVLKIPLSNATPQGSEAKFLRAWESVGVPVPHVHREGTIGEREFLLMDFIDAPLLFKESKNYSPEQNKELSYEAGKTLRQMHTTKAEGYGRVHKEGPQFNTFKEWLLDEDMKERIAVVQENNLLTDEHGSLTKAMDLLLEHAEQDPASTYCHFDYGFSNMLDTRPITIIDPDPMFNKAVIDLGRSVFLGASASGSPDAGNELKEGYFSDGANIDDDVLQAAILISGYMKFPYWHKKNQVERIGKIQEYLSQTRDRLDK